MSHRKTIQLDVTPEATGTGIGRPSDVSEMVDKNIQVGGTFIATYSIEGVLDELLLDEFVALPNLAGLTGVVLLPMLEGIRRIRVNITAHTSGQIEVFVGGRIIR